MPRIPLHALIWSEEQRLYALYTRGQLTYRFRPAEEAAWLAWQREATSFAFHGVRGSLNVYRETRPRGGSYWYAYHKTRSRTRKRYLGSSVQMTFAYLEEMAEALASEPAPSPLDVSHLPPPAEQPLLLSGRLALPQLPHALVERERLLLVLDEALATRLTLLSAPAGWGKTTLLSAWASRHQAQVAWLSLDELDTSPTRFWVSLIAALRHCERLGPQIGETALGLLQSPQPPPLSSCLSTLLHELESRKIYPASIVLIVDDYQVIEEPSIHQSLAFFLEHLPTHLHVILASRVDPDLPLSRWRVRGHLNEIRADDLRFGEVEANHFLSRMLFPPPSPEEVHLLTLRTEGWIAGLQLAALALQKRADRAAFLQAFTGSQRYLLDYVQEEILARLPEEARDFLLQSAILWRLDASVCQAVTAAPTAAACQQMLAFLERANLFLVPLDEERRSYRLHDLFREALCACLHASQPELVPLLHLRAARWYEAAGELREAIAHAMAAADYPYAALLLERGASSFWLNGEAQAVHHWLQALPDVILWQYARLALNAALRLLNLSHESTEVSYAHTQAQVEQTLARVEAGLHRKLDLGISETEVALIERRLRLLQALIELRTIVKHDDPGRQIQLAQEVEGLPQDEEVIWNMIPLSMIFWLRLTYEREAVSLLPRLLKVKQQALESGDFLARIRVMAWLTMTYAQLGQLHRVQQECRQALTLIEQTSGHTAMAAYLHISLFHVYYAWNRLQEASEEVNLLKQIGQQWQQMDLQVMGEVYSAHLSLAMGNLGSAQEALHKAEALVEQESYDYYALWVSLLQVQCWLAEANLSRASEWAVQITFTLETWDPARTSEFLMLVRISLAQQKYAQAVEVLERFREQLDRPADIEKTIEFLALYVIALHCANESEQTADVAARLLTMTEPEGCIRVYLDAGEPMKQVLQSLLETASTKAEPAQSSPEIPISFLSKLLLAFEQEEKNLRYPPLREPTPSGALPFPQRDSSPSHPSAESLTQREQEVLHLLAGGASNQQIADALVIELSTVKKHVSNLLGKLGVQNRTQAITRARTLSLL